MKKILTIITFALTMCDVVMAKPPIEIKVISFNIRTIARDGDNNWENRRHATRNMLNMHNPDLFGLQEAMKPHLKYIDLSPDFAPEYVHDQIYIGGATSTALEIISFQNLIP